MTGGYSYEVYQYDSKSEDEKSFYYYSTYGYPNYSYLQLSSTEIYIPGQDYGWSFASPLPEPVYYTGSVSLYNNIYLIGE